MTALAPLPPGQVAPRPGRSASDEVLEGATAVVPTTSRHRRRLALVGLVVGLGAAVIAALALGSVRLSPLEVVTALVSPDAADDTAVRVVRLVRLPRTVAAALSGAALAVAGTQMQTIFRNPLYDPYVLGVSSGASFGVAVVVLGVGSGASTWLGGLGALGSLGVAGAAFVGAAGAALVALAVAKRVEGMATVLVVGLMIGAVLSALVSLIVAGADPIRLQQWMAWNQGSFRGVTADELWFMVPAVVVGLGLALASTKALNALLLGERYAGSMGVPVRRTRVVVLLSASLLAGIVTAYAGPIAFVGVAAAHLGRAAVGTSDHRSLLPAAALVGASMTLVAEVVAQLPGQAGVLPLNAVTALLGAPVVIWVLVRRRRSEIVT